MEALSQRSSTEGTGAVARFRVNDDQRRRIAAIPHLASGSYQTLDPEQTLFYFYRFFVEPCPISWSALAGHTIADLGAGYGWLAMAFAAYTDASVIAVEIEAERLEAGRLIADILGLSQRIDWRPGGLGFLPMADREADISYTVEVLEHVGGDVAVFADLERVTRTAIILTTPNRFFPVIAHDTRLPFCHMLPVRWRDLYARLAGRGSLQHGNLFWSAGDIRTNLPHFERASRIFQFDDLQDYVARFPCYMPYNGGAIRHLPAAKALWSRIATLAGRKSDYLLPNLAGVYLRQAD